ncbi:unnamed protein product [Linum trigynum]|uniref:Uncharacterized protein n=1 Tax=Linum trigynum TaxID=586398 RepID=A0AAV2F767_9ROSI
MRAPQQRFHLPINQPHTLGTSQKFLINGLFAKKLSRLSINQSHTLRKAKHPSTRNFSRQEKTIPIIYQPDSYLGGKPKILKMKLPMTKAIS